MKRLTEKLLTHPSETGEFIEVADKHIYVAKGVDTRVVSTKNGKKLPVRKDAKNKNRNLRMLKKFEFNSQNEMHEFAKDIDEPLMKDVQYMPWADHAKEVTGKRKYYEIYSMYNRDSSWAFGDNKESNNADKVDNLLRDGRATKSVQRIIRKTIKDVKLEGIDTMLTERFESVKRKRVWSDDGSELDIDRVMCGDPNHWVKSKRNGKKRVIRIGVNMSASAGNKAKTFGQNVALAYLASEQLETLGYGVEIVALSCAYASGRNNLNMNDDENAYTFPLKRSTEPTDINRIGSIGLPSLLRYYGFRVSSALFRQDNGICMATSKEMKGFLNIDVLIETTWSMEAKEQATRIMKNISQIIEGGE